METSTVSSIANDMAPKPAKSPYDAKKVAKDFEALFANYMLKSMRKSIMRSDLIPESTGENIYTEMLDNEYSKILTENTDLGLADIIAKELEKQGQSINALKDLNMKPWTANYKQGISAATPSTASTKERLAPYANDIKSAAQQYNLDSDLVSAVISCESNGNPNAISRAGAKGLMQLMDSTATQMGVSQVFDPTQNIMGGAKYLREMLDRFNGDEKLAIASYNAGPTAVERHEGVPPYRETQDYVKKVLSLRSNLAQDSLTGKD